MINEAIDHAESSNDQEQLAVKNGNQQDATVEESRVNEDESASSGV